MYIESVQPLNYGPFALPETLLLDRDVTVLTGPNDVGKSSVLRLLQRILTNDPMPIVDEFNSDNEHDGRVTWDHRDEFGAILRVRFGEGDTLPPGMPSHNPPPTGFSAKINIAPQNRGRVICEVLVDGRPVLNGSWPFPDAFQILVLPPQSDIRSTIDFATANPVEHALFVHALGREFHFAKLATSPPARLDAQLLVAEETLNVSLRRLLPNNLGLKWKLRLATDQKAVYCYLTDAHGSYTSLGMRGTGIQKSMAVLATLMAQNFEKKNWLVLFDEPEASLHADSQHLLRQVLEEVGAKPNVQVVYSTHSPSMINTMRPHAIRLLRRDNRKNKPATFIDNRPFKENFFPVRASLGLTPADSLLYASVTVVVEGDTEVVGLPLLLLKLADASVPGFERVRHLLAQSHFIDGMGDQFAYVCRLAASQGAKPVVFLDGDKGRHLPKFGLAPEIPIVLLEEAEFEQVVPPGMYLQAVGELIEGDSTAVSIGHFQNWETGARLHSRMAFTKRIARWLDSLEICEPSKAAVMRRAIEIVRPEQVNARRLLDLVNQIAELLPK